MLAFEAVCGFEETGRQGSKPHTARYLSVLESTPVYPLIHLLTLLF